MTLRKKISLLIISAIFIQISAVILIIESISSYTIFVVLLASIILITGIAAYLVINKYILRKLDKISGIIGNNSNDELDKIYEKFIAQTEEVKKVRLQLQKNEEQYKAFIEDKNELVFRFDTKLNCTFLNKPLHDFLGKKPEELLGKPVISLLKDKSNNDRIDEFASNLLHLKTSVYENNILNFNGEPAFIEWTIHQIKEYPGTLLEFQAIGRNITERKKAEEALRESRARNIALLKAIPDLVFRFQKCGKLLDYHIPPSENLKIPADRLLTNKMNGVFSEDLACKIDYLIDQAFETAEIQVFEYQTIDNDETFYEEIRIIATEEDEYIVIIRDITERKRTEEEIKKYIEEMQFNEDILAKNSYELQELYGKLSESEIELKELNAKKDKFFSIISHDLRSPFTAIVGFSKFLVDEINELPHEQIKSFASNIYESANSVLKLLENLLYWSRLQTNRILFEPQQIIFKSLVDQTFNLYKANALEKRIRLISEIAPDCIIWADQNMLEAVLRNLVSNAIKFTRDEGTICISAQKKSSDIVISVQDSGVGIPETHIKKLFKIEDHVTTEGTNREKGTGLGLILCKEFVEKNGGTIKVESELNKGSKFIFTLPAA